MARSLIDPTGVPWPPELLAPIAARLLRARRSAANATLPFPDWLPVAQPELDWTARHLRYIAAKLEDVSQGRVKRLLLSAPPRHAKSTMATILWPVNMLERNPAFRVCVGSHNAEKAADFGRKARKLAEARIPSLDPRRQLVTDWQTIEGGVYRSVGRGNPPMGEGFNAIIIDDPIASWADANSRATRDYTWDWVLDLVSRLEPGGVVIMPMHRWHEDDPAGRALQAEDAADWTVVNLTAVAEAGDELAREPGEALWPERWPLPELEARMRIMAPSKREALFFGRPTSPEGHALPVQKLMRCKAADVPKGLPRCRAWDLASTALNRADYTVGVLMEGPDDRKRFFIREIVRGQWETAARNDVLVATRDRDAAREGPATKVRVPRDQKGDVGKDIVHMLKTLLSPAQVFGVRPEGTKEARAELFSGAMDGQLVYLVEDERWPNYWERGVRIDNLKAAHECYLEELRAFPMSGRHDDQVDATVDAHHQLTHATEAVHF